MGRKTTLEAVEDKTPAKATAPATAGKESPGIEIIKTFDPEALRKLHQAAHKMQLGGPKEFVATMVPLVEEYWNKPHYAALDIIGRQKAIANAILSKASVKKAKTESIRLIVLDKDPIRGDGEGKSEEDKYQKVYCLCPQEKMAFTLIAKTTGIKAIESIRKNQSGIFNGVSVSRDEKCVFATKGEISITEIKDEKPTLEQAKSCLEIVSVPSLVARMEKYTEDNQFVLVNCIVASVGKPFDNGNGAYHTITDAEMNALDDEKAADFSGISLMVPTEQGRWGEGAEFWSAFTAYRDRKKKTYKANSRFMEVTLPVKPEQVDEATKAEAENKLPADSEPSEGDLAELYKLV